MSAKSTLLRLLSLAGSGLLGFGLAAALLALLPAANTAAAPATSHNYPGSAPCATTLQACINGLAAGETIVVLPGTYTQSATLDHAVSLVKGAGGPATLLAAPGQRVLTVTGAAINHSVVISGLTFAGGHAAGAACPSGCGGGLMVTAGAQPLFENDVISRNVADFYGGGIYTAPGSPLTLLGVTFISNTANGAFYGSSGGGVYVSGDLTATNAQFIRNAALFNGGGGYVTGTTTLSGGLFQGNTALAQGGALYLSGTLTLTGTQFIANSLSSVGGNGGGAVEMSGRPGMTLSLNGGLFEDNSTGAGLVGGALNAEAHLPGDSFLNMHPITVTVVGTQFISNSSQGIGGGLSLLGGYTTIVNGRFERNQNGALANTYVVEGGDWLVLTDTDVLSNSTAHGDGAIFVEGPATVSGGLFQGNHAGLAGAALAVNGSASISGTRFISNSSDSFGGGAWVNITTTVTNVLFQGNRADSGGGLWAANYAIDLANTTFVDNQAITGTGGGLYAGSYPDLVSVVDSQFVSNTAATDGGGLYILSPAALANTRVLSNAAGGNGGGLYTVCCLSDSGGLFSGNHALGNGGGLYVFSLTASLTGTQLISNSAIGQGGGLYTGGPSTLLQGWLEGNSAASGGGAYAAGALLAARSAFLNNSAASGGGLYQAGPGGQVVNSLFAGDQASAAGAGLYFAGGSSSVIFDTLAGAAPNPRQAIVVAAGTLHVTDTILAGYAAGLSRLGGTLSEDFNLFFGNTADKAGTISSGGHSLFGQDPLFINPAVGPSGYHLHDGSPALDHGTNVNVHVDYDGDPRPVGTGYDIGFDERSSTLFLPFVNK